MVRGWHCEPGRHREAALKGKRRKTMKSGYDHSLKKHNQHILTFIKNNQRRGVIDTRLGVTIVDGVHYSELYKAFIKTNKMSEADLDASLNSLISYSAKIYEPKIGSFRTV